MKFLKNWTIDLEKLPNYTAFKAEFQEPLDKNLASLINEDDRFPECVRTSFRNNIVIPLLQSKNSINKVKYTQPFNMGRYYGKDKSICDHKKAIKHTLMKYCGYVDADMVKGHPTPQERASNRTLT